jgi:hypothetical protein
MTKTFIIFFLPENSPHIYLSGFFNRKYFTWKCVKIKLEKEGRDLGDFKFRKEREIGRGVGWR